MEGDVGKSPVVDEADNTSYPALLDEIQKLRVYGPPPPRAKSHGQTIKDKTGNKTASVNGLGKEPYETEQLYTQPSSQKTEDTGFSLFDWRFLRG